VGVPVAAGDLVGRGDDCLGHLAVEHAELGVDGRRRGLDPSQRLDVRPLERCAADREVLHRALRLGAPLRILRDAYLAHRVVFHPKVSVRHAFRPSTAVMAQFPS
jgi:hypothetical protein